MKSNLEPRSGVYPYPSFPNARIAALSRIVADQYIKYMNPVIANIQPEI